MGNVNSRLITSEQNKEYKWYFKADYNTFDFRSCKEYKDSSFIFDFS